MAAATEEDVVVDALPYVDAEYAELKEQVQSLVEAEMRTFQPRDYLEAVPDYTPTFVRARARPV